MLPRKFPVLIITLLLVGIVPAVALDGDNATDGAAAALAVDVPDALLFDAGDALEPSALRAAAQAGGFVLTLGDRQATLVLNPNELVAPDAFVRLDGQDADAAVADVDLYTGRIVGESNSHARLAFTDDWAEGYVYAFGTLFDLRTLEGAARLVDTTDLAAEYGIIDIEAPPGAAVDPTGKQGLSGCLGLVPEVADNPAGFLTGWGPVLFYDIIVDSDRAFYQHGPSDWAARQLSHMNRVDGFYQANFDLKIRVVGQSADSAGTVYTSTDPSTLLLQARSRWVNDPAVRDTVQLLSHVEFDGVVVGQANCIGGAHSKVLHYTVTQTLGFTEFGASKITTHELGHMMSAHHHYSNCHDTMPVVSTMPCTVMTPDAGLMNNAVVFSMLSRNTIRGYAEGYL